MTSGVYNHKNNHTNRGMIRTKKWLEKQVHSMKGKNKGKNQWMWMGDNVGYLALHSWVARWKGKANHCEVCGISEKRTYHWANIDHKYRRVLEDYISMCVPCHRKYDIKNNKIIKNS